MEGDLASRMVEGMHRLLIAETGTARTSRQALWNRDFASRGAYDRSIAPARDRLRTIIGATDHRVPFDSPALDSTITRSARLAATSRYEVLAVRWPVLEGIEAEGLMLKPQQIPRARVVALPDADWTPEMLAGLSPGVSPQAQFARRLSENGCLVLIPTLIDRKDTWSGNPEVRMTNQPHREFVYRMAYFAGRHIIGYEVQKVLAAVDWFSRETPRLPIGVMGYGEGGLIALYSAAVDTRVDATVVSGYFRDRDNLWAEPIYRNVWSLLRQFGDAELAGMVAPRTLIVEASVQPVVVGPPPESKNRRGAAPGKLSRVPLTEIRGEFERAAPAFEKLGAAKHLSLVADRDGRGQPGSGEALARFLRGLRNNGLTGTGSLSRMLASVDPDVRLHRQFDQLVRFTQAAIRDAEKNRKKFWSRADDSSVQSWIKSTEWYRRYFWEEMVGKLPEPAAHLAAQTRLIYDEPKWTAYEVVIPMWQDVYAYGILLLPKEMKPGERRPVIVTQHGLEGRPQEVIKPHLAQNETYYAHYAARLADRGFIVYAPQNPTLGGNLFRQVQRRANPLQLSLFSFILDQHQRTLDWLISLPFVDPQRIGFYGLSYGGVTAMRVPPLLGRYLFSICSANFTLWVWKIESYEFPASYLFIEEYEMTEFNFANTFNYSELASLLAPRPFMVERGHSDPAAPDEWVAYEYAKVRRRYALLGIPDRTEIEFFDGGHVIHHEGTFRFVHRYLNWPEPDRGEGRGERA